MILHWLGPMFDPALEGYWGSDDLDAATGTFLEVIAAHPDKVDGIKVSLLDAEREVDLRRRLPQGVRCYTGDDFNYPELIAGDEAGFSHALLGIFDPLGAAGRRGGARPGHRGRRGFRAAARPDRRSCPATSSRRRPASTRRAWCCSAWLAGHQSHFTMVGGLAVGPLAAASGARLRTRRRAGPVPRPGLAEARMKNLLLACTESHQ